MELMIPLKSRSEIPMYQQIYLYLKEEIKNGGLKAQTRLPSTRNLAEQLRVSRSTTQMAYEQLLSEGYIEAVPCRGYYVAVIDALVAVGVPGGAAGGGFPKKTDGKNAARSVFGGESEAGEEARPEWEARSEGETWAEREARLEREPWAEAGERRDPAPSGGRESIEADFSPRGIDLDNFPFNTWRKITRNTLADGSRELFAAGDPQGELLLRETVREYLHAARGVNCGAEQIIVGAGSEYLLMLLHQILGGGRKIAMENPTYKQAYRVLKSLGNQVIPVEMDKYGMDVERLAQSGADTAYVMPSHQYPMGIVMPVKRRQELLSWAGSKPGRYLIEDDYDSEFRYKGKPIPALQGMDGGGRVIYIGTFSKSVAPAIRVSFMALPKELFCVYRERCYFYASTVSRIDQNILYRFITEGHYERHLNRMRAIYKAKRDALLAGLKPLEGGFSIRGENAGLHLLLTHRNGMDEAELVKKAYRAGARVYGLSSCLIGDGNPGGRPSGLPPSAPPPAGGDFRSSTVILGYANLSEEQIRRGAVLLERAWK